MTQKITNTKTVFDNPFLPIVEHTIEKDDVTYGRLVVEKKPCVVVLIRNMKSDTVVLTREFRAGVGSVTTSFPAGIIDEGELPIVAASREVKEETGYTPDWIESLGHGHVSEGWTTEVAHYFYAEVGEEVPDAQSLDEDEYIEVLERPWDELLALVKSGEILSNHALGCYLKYKLKYEI